MVRVLSALSALALRRHSLFAPHRASRRHEHGPTHGPIHDPSWGRIRAIAPLALALVMAGQGAALGQKPGGRTLCTMDVKPGEELALHAGPSADTARTGGIKAGTCGIRVEEKRCVARWCPVTDGRISGWANTYFLGIYEARRDDASKAADKAPVRVDPKGATAGTLTTLPPAPVAPRAAPGGTPPRAASVEPKATGEVAIPIPPAAVPPPSVPPATKITIVPPTRATDVVEPPARRPVPPRRAAGVTEEPRATAPAVARKKQPVPRRGETRHAYRGEWRSMRRPLAPMPPPGVVARDPRWMPMGQPIDMRPLFGSFRRSDRHERYERYEGYTARAVVGPSSLTGGRCVVAVTRGDTLRVRTGPSLSHEEIGGLAPGTCGVAVVGTCRGLWCQVGIRGVRGWVNTYYLR